jgi:hypothetical protein
VSGQQEKFLFYRGLADFPPAIRARESGQHAVLVENTGADVVPHAMLFESDGRRFGYRVTETLETSVTLPRPELTSDLASLRRDLGAMLVEQGLFPKEADAMLDTWRDSWFEPGLRVLYLVPRTSVDAILPLAITPAPQTTARVFVGRMEIVTESMQSAVARAVDRNDLAALAKYGRFLEPAMDQLWYRAESDALREQIETAFRAAAKILSSEEKTCRAPGSGQ